MNLARPRHGSVVTAPLTAAAGRARALEARRGSRCGGGGGAAAIAGGARARPRRSGPRWRRILDLERARGVASKRTRAASPSVVAHLARPSEGFTSLILASRALEPLDALRGGAPVRAERAERRAEAPRAARGRAAALRRERLAVNLALTELAARHQVLPGRTPDGP